MRVFLAALLVIALAPAAAQQKPAEVPAAFLSPTLMDGWQPRPIYPTAEQSLQLALAWAEAPNGHFLLYSAQGDALLGGAKGFEDRHAPIAARPLRSTVGQGH